MMFGVISFKGVVNVIFYIFIGIVFLVLLAVVLLRYRVYRVRRDMERRMNGEPNVRGKKQGRKEGQVTVKNTRASKDKVVSNQVGDYVEYEDIDEE